VARLGRTHEAHAGIFLVPLGRTNLSHDAAAYEFWERSLVATQILGVPNAQLGVGVGGAGSWSRTTPLRYEVDIVTGFDDGVIMDASGGTRIPAGRNNYADQNGLPAAVARFAIQPGRGEVGVAIQSGPYNRPTWRAPRWTERGSSTCSRPTGSLTPWVSSSRPRPRRRSSTSRRARRALRRAPVGRVARGHAHAPRPVVPRLARHEPERRVPRRDRRLRRRLPGDSRTRVAASLNIRPQPTSILRFGWYYEWKRDRFDNLTPLAGLTLTAASYF
jgi:hypothetical protein